MRRFGIFALIALLSLSLSTCADQDEANETARQLPLLGANVESGWPGVGALTFQYPGYGYQGSFCTGALIAPRWVLTAAHCLVSHDDFELSPEIVQFYVGTNATPTNSWSGWPSAGEFFQADAFFIHPDYNPNDTSSTHDIGLLHLAQPATGIETYPYNTSVLKGSNVGSAVFYVGYGATEGLESTGGGMKRSGFIDLTYVDETEYYSDYEGTGVCFGDSGGPGFLEIGGQTRIIGINSRVGGDEGSDPCQGSSAHPRVDYYAAWIANYLDAPPLNCNSQPDLCYCPAACNAPTGNCDNQLCQTEDCESLYTCLGDCGEDSGCAADCYITGTEEGKAELDTLFQCFAQYCEALEGEAWSQCASDNCGDAIATCFPVGTGPLSCEEVYTCYGECPQDDGTCNFGCFEQGTAMAQTQVEAMTQCLIDNCSDIEDDNAWYECINANCSQEIATCFPPSNCDVAGGDCEAASACYPSAGGNTDCFPSTGIALGQPCNADSTGDLECADGGLCITSAASATCMQMCTANDDCGSGDYCFAPIFQDVADIGICLCIDEDEDTWCQVADCDDLSPDINPDAVEVCGDGVDNNCDGAIDEGCGECTDFDGDGVCVPEDCDDTRLTVYPGAPEDCGDGLDNNCDGAIDEGCPAGCPDGDADQDGVCLDADCNDVNPAVYPGAPEACGDALDNDCDGDTDEGCEDCIDADSDAYCAGSGDCDDSNRDISPASPELCDGVDNNCDGATDEGCEGCVDADRDGYCLGSSDCDDGDANRNPTSTEICGDGIDQDCDGADLPCPTLPTPGAGTGTTPGGTSGGTIAGTGAGGDAPEVDNASTGGCESGQGHSGLLFALLCGLWALGPRRLKLT